MANPVLNDLVLEGLKKAGENNPSSDLVTRASTEWMEEIKNDIWNLAKKPKILQITAYTIVPIGQSRYAYPVDYSSDLTLILLYGTNQGTSQGGSSNTVILNAGNKSGTEILGKEILMMSGASQGSFAQIVTYDPTTKVAGVIPNFSTAPSAGDAFMIVDVEYPIETRPIYEWDRTFKLVSPGLPQYAYPIGDDIQGYFVFDKPPNMTYGCRLRYYSDLSLLDVQSSLMSTLYRKWRNLWVEGIKYKKISDENDDREADSFRDYQSHLKAIMWRDIYGMDISNINDKISDYR